MVKEFLEYVFSLLKSRFVPLFLVFILLFSTLISRVFTLQIINGETYSIDLSDSIKKTTSVQAARGRIYDKNGVLLAYNELAYAVKISDSGVYSNNAAKNKAVNNTIAETLKIIEEKGDWFTNTFQVIVNENGEYEYTVTGNSRLRFLRDTLGKAKLADLSEEERNYTATQLIDAVCERYAIDKTQYPAEHVIEIIYLRLKMSANSYNRHMSFTIAEEVSDKTVAAILENSDRLTGVTIEEQYIRKYVDGLYCSQILGYTGAVDTEELAELKLTDSSYELNDSVGKDGIEKSMEKYLAGEKGKKTVYVDTVGRVTEVIEETDSSAGSDIYLTIDIELQKRLYNTIEDNLVDILLKYMTASDSKYEYYSDGSIRTVYITQKDVYYALLDNNLIPLNKLKRSESGNAKVVYDTFYNHLNSTKEWLNREFYSSPTPYSKLSDINRSLIWYLYNDIMRYNGILLTSNIDVNDSNYQQWISGGDLSFESFLKYAISKNWIDMTLLTSQQYTSLTESYDLIVEYLMDIVEDDSNFHKMLYKVLIQNGKISGKQLCMSLYELGILEEDELYKKLKNGSISSYEYVRSAISQKLFTPAQLVINPYSGAVVMMDPNNGNVIALSSYPSYDNNKLTGNVDGSYYRQLILDKSKPLYNWATQSQCAPGSTFKICSAIAGLDLGIIDSNSQFSCTGVFTQVTPNPRCHERYGHGVLAVSGAIKHSCNVFFYNVAYDMATKKTGVYNSDFVTDTLKSYAEKLGLATLSGIEIAESTPHPSNELAISSVIGQGTNKYSALNLARYTATIANSGTCYNATLLSKIVANDGTVILENKPTVASKMELSSSIWNDVHYGMETAVDIYQPLKKMKNRKFAAKTGTAQERSDEPDHALMISYYPSNNPEIAMAVMIPHGYGSISAQELMASAYLEYFDLYNK